MARAINKTEARQLQGGDNGGGSGGGGFGFFGFIGLVCLPNIDRQWFLDFLVFFHRFFLRPIPITIRRSGAVRSVLGRTTPPIFYSCGANL